MKKDIEGTPTLTNAEKSSLAVWPALPPPGIAERGLQCAYGPADPADHRFASKMG